MENSSLDFLPCRQRGVPSAGRWTQNQFPHQSCGKPRSPEDPCTGQPEKRKKFNFSFGDSCSDIFESIITLIKILKKRRKKTSEQYLLRKQTLKELLSATRFRETFHSHLLRPGGRGSVKRLFKVNYFHFRRQRNHQVWNGCRAQVLGTGRLTSAARAMTTEQRQPLISWRAATSRPETTLAPYNGCLQKLWQLPSEPECSIRVKS